MNYGPSSRYQDRIESSVRAYQNPLRQDPWARNVYAASEARSRDRIETRRERTNRELIEKFQKNHFKLASGGITMLVHLGKGIVLVLVMPPYFLLFVAPKWAFHALKPAAEKAEELAGQFFFRVSAWTVDLYSGFANQFSQFFNRFKRKKKEPKEKIKPPLDPRIVSFKENFARKMAQIGHAIRRFRSFRQGLYEGAWQFISKKKQAVQKRGREILRKLQDQSARLAEKVQGRFQRWLAPKKEKALKAAKAVDRALEKTYLLFKKPFVKAAELLAKAFEPIAVLVKAVSAFIPATVMPPLNWFQQTAASLLKRTSQLVVNRGPFLQKKWEAVTSILSQAVSAVYKPIAQAGLWMAHTTQRVMETVRVKVVKAASLIAFTLKRAVNSVLDEGQRQFKRFASWSHKKALQAAQAALSAGRVLKRVPRLLWNVLKKIGKTVYRLMTRIFRAARVTFVLIRYLVSQSLTQLEKSLHKTQ